MKYLSQFGAGVVIAALSVCSAVGAGVDADTLGKLDMVSINRIQVTDADNAYILEVEVTFQNKGPEAVKLRNGVFQTLIETKEEGRNAILNVGNTTMDELEIPGAANKRTPGTAKKKVTAMLGPKDSDTTAKLVRLWNVLGNPAASMVMVSKGTSEVGVKLPKGWVFEQGKTYEVELRFLPTVQRKVLFM